MSARHVVGAVLQRICHHHVLLHPICPAAITVGSERFRAPEVLFDPSLVGLEAQGIHHLVRLAVDLVADCPVLPCSHTCAGVMISLLSISQSS